MEERRQNRREMPRVMVNSSCPTRLEDAEAFIQVYVLNVSKYGMQLEAPKETLPRSVSAGNNLTLFIQTPFGPCRWTGEVRWAEAINGHLRWGMKFSEDFGRPSNPIAVMWKAAQERDVANRESASTSS